MLKLIKKALIDLCLLILGFKSQSIGSLYDEGNKEDIQYHVNDKLKFIGESKTNKMILTPSGAKPIHTILKTVPFYKTYIHTKNEEICCADEHLIFSVSQQEFIFAKNISKGDVICTLYGDETVQDVKNTYDYDNMYDIDINDFLEHTYYTNNILSHNTTTIGAYLLWYAAFRSDEDPVTILVVSNKGENAKEIIERIKTMYESMPLWLKPGVTDDGYNKHSIKFDNGSCIVSQATTENSGRGLSISLLFCHHKDNKVEVMDNDNNIYEVSMSELEELLKA